MFVVAVFDRKAQLYGSFRTVESLEGQAVNFLRAISALQLTDPTCPLAMFPEDFELVSLGSVDVLSGVLLSDFQTLAFGSDAVRSSEV